MRLRSIFSVLALTAVMATAAGVASAQGLNFSLGSNVQSVVQGGFVTFVSTLTDTLSTDSLSLDSSDVTFNFTSSGLTLTDDFASTPISLTGSTGLSPTWTGTLFTVSVASSAAPGSYIGSYEVDYTNLTTTGSSFVTQNFEVDVFAATITPEPGSTSMLIGLAASIGILSRLRYCKRNSGREVKI